MQLIANIQALVSLERASLLAYIGFLENADVKDDETFAKVIEHALIHCDLSKKQLAGEFGIDSTTIGRWASGKTTPHQLVRPIVTAYIHDFAKAQAVSIKSQRDDIETFDRFAAAAIA